MADMANIIGGEAETELLDVAVVGGGPAGLSATLALLQVMPNLRIKVFEAGPAYMEQGAGVVVALNGARALEAINPTILHRLLDDANFVSASWDYNDETGERMPWVIGGNARESLEKNGYAFGIVAWNSLRTALYSCIPEGTVVFGCKIIGCSAAQGSDEAGNGSEGNAQQLSGGEGGFTLRAVRDEPHSGPTEVRIRARHVIAADGYFSRLRRQLGDGRAPAFADSVRWLASLTEADLAAGRVPLPACVDRARDPEALTSAHKWLPVSADRPMDSRPRRGLMLYGAGRTPDRGARLVWTLWCPLEALEAAGEPFPMPLSKAGDGSPLKAEADDEPVSVQTTKRRGAEALRRALAAAVHLPADVRAMLAATPAERVQEFGLYLHSPETYQKGAWARGRLLLLGDAAHAGRPDGQGANTALEDAAVLGDMVRAHGLGPEAFSLWEEARMERVRDILHDPSLDASGRMRRVLGSAFEPLWCPARLAARGGPLPEDVARDVAAAVAAGGTQKGREVVLAWSRAQVRRITESKLVGRIFPKTVQPPPGMYRFR